MLDRWLIAIEQIVQLIAMTLRLTDTQKCLIDDWLQLSKLSN